MDSVPINCDNCRELIPQDRLGQVTECENCHANLCPNCAVSFKNFHICPCCHKNPDKEKAAKIQRHLRREGH
jgi:hypothetical protein